MQRPSREFLGFLAVLVIVAGLFVTLALLPAAHTRTTSSLVDSCSTATSTDVQINLCLDQKLRAMQGQMTSALRRESTYLSFNSPSQGLAVARRVQSAFTAYVHQECLAESNPYQPGTIVPIIYGDCALAVFRQRLALLDAQINYFKAGGEASSTT